MNMIPVPPCMGIFHVLIYYLIHFPPCLTSAQPHGHLRLILTDPWPLRNNNNNKKTISSWGLGATYIYFAVNFVRVSRIQLGGFADHGPERGSDNEVIRSCVHAASASCKPYHTDSIRTLRIFGRRASFQIYFYTDTTFHIFATPSSPTVAIKSSYPFLGHHVIEFTSLTSCAFSRRAISLYLGGLRCVESGSSWDHTSQTPATHTAR